MNDLLAVKSSKELQFAVETMLVRVDYIPVCMMASKEKEKLNGMIQGRVRQAMNGFCADRCFERLPGYIDITVKSVDSCKTLLPDDSSTKMAIPVCLTSEADEILLASYNSLIDMEHKH